MTSLKYGSTLKKSDDRIELLGDVDELNSHIGLAKAAAGDDMKKKLSQVQETLIFLMSGVSDPRNRSLRFPESYVADLEKEIDAVDSSFLGKKQDVLYGGCELSARLDVACTVARRAERRFVKMKLVYGGDMAAMQYMNRLSDYLYILARYADYLNEKTGTECVSETYHKQESGKECTCGKQETHLECNCGTQGRKQKHHQKCSCGTHGQSEKYEHHQKCSCGTQENAEADDIQNKEEEIRGLISELIKKLNL